MRSSFPFTSEEKIRNVVSAHREEEIPVGPLDVEVVADDGDRVAPERLGRVDDEGLAALVECVGELSGILAHERAQPVDGAGREGRRHEPPESRVAPSFGTQQSFAVELVELGAAPVKSWATSWEAWCRWLSRKSVATSS